MEPLPEDDIWLLLDRYLDGDASASDVETIRAWLAADRARAEVLTDLRRIRELAARRPPARSVNAAWSAVAHATGIAARRRATPVRVPRAAPEKSRWMAAAAIVLVVIGGGGALEVVASRRAVQPAAPIAAAPHVFSTQRGQRAEVRLVDGTRVTLAPASRLIVPADFDIAHRDVSLEGRAMLTVVHNDRKPFIVHARSAVVLDVGTRFDVSAYPEDHEVVVVVTEGVVRLRDSSAAPSSAVEMKRGSVGRVAANGKTTAVHDVDTDRITTWTDGTLEFDEARVPDAMAELARWYDVDVRIADPSLATRRVTATLRDQALPDILELFAIGLGARVERHGRTVVFHALDTPPASH